MRPQAGQVINNKYRLVRVIGDGGMGSVYEARHEVLGTTVALKFLHPELSRRSGLVQRFLQEARVSAQIQSPHVVRVIDVDQSTNGLAFLVMEYVEGRTLQTLYEDLYRAGVRLSYEDALEYAMQMLEGVEAAHRTGVVHRDLKPDNVMITKSAKGEPLLKLLDFGIAKLKVTGELDRGLTRPGVIMGTPEYMAPEQAYSADAVDARADIFSLGVMTFEMLAGRRPVGGDEPQQIAAAYLSGQISKLSDLAPDLAPGLCAAVHRAMAALPADRFASVTEFRDAIRPFAHAARAPSAITPAPGDVRQQLRASGVASPAPSTPSGAVPKTIPPEGEPDAGSGPPMPPGFSTPLGGFSSDARAAAAAPPSSPRGYPAAHAGSLPATVSATPYVPPHAAHGVPATSIHAGAIDASARPGGTAIGDAASFGVGGGPSGPNGGAAAYAYGGAGYGSATQSYVPGTAPMDPLQGARLSGGTTAQRRPPKSGASLIVILLLAMGITGAVIGGVYVAHEFGRPRERADVAPLIPTVQPAVTVPSDPTPASTAAPEPQIPIAVDKPKPKPTTRPAPSGPATQPTSPAPTTKPSGPNPFPFPPLVIPSTLPFPLPLPGTQPPAQQPTGQQPTGSDPSQPGPAPSSTTRRRGTIILVPGGN